MAASHPCVVVHRHHIPLRTILVLVSDPVWNVPSFYGNPSSRGVQLELFVILRAWGWGVWVKSTGHHLNSHRTSIAILRRLTSPLEVANKPKEDKTSNEHDANAGADGNDQGCVV